MKIGPLVPKQEITSAPVQTLEHEVLLDLVKDFLVIALSFYVPHMTSDQQDLVFASCPQIRRKNYSQLVGAFSPIDELGYQQKHQLLMAIAQTKFKYTEKSAKRYAKRLEELGLVSKTPVQDRYEDRLELGSQT